MSSYPVSEGKQVEFLHGRGTVVAQSPPMSRTTDTPARRHSRGFTLMELLVVLVGVGIVSAIAMYGMNSFWQKQKMTSSVRDVVAFLQSVQGEMTRQNRPLFVRLLFNADGSGKVVQICRVPDNVPAAKDIIRQLSIPDTVSLSLTDPKVVACKYDGTYTSATVCSWPALGVDTPSSTIPGLLQCDLLGRTNQLVAGTSFPPAQTTVPVVLTMTHRDMVTGTLRPRFRHVITIYPIWQVRIEQQTF